MIGYLEGKIINIEAECILLLSGNIGYEVLLNIDTLEKIKADLDDDNFISLYVYFHQTERQPKPVLIGFGSLEEKEFFQMFITVDAIGPMKAIKALNRPIGEIAYAIENKDVAFLSTLSGIGKRTAEKIIATLNGKVTKFVLVSGTDINATHVESKSMPGITDLVFDVLVNQLGHSGASAKRLITRALKKNEDVKTPEELFDAIFLEENKK